jgi:hypothetical protein
LVVSKRALKVSGALIFVHFCLNSFGIQPIKQNIKKKYIKFFMGLLFAAKVVNNTNKTLLHFPNTLTKK